MLLSCLTRDCYVLLDYLPITIFQQQVLCVVNESQNLSSFIYQ